MISQMTARNKKILWMIAVATVVALVLLYILCPPVHRWGNSLLGRNEKELPKPDTTRVEEYEYGTPVEEITAETIDVPRDSVLDSLMRADTIPPGIANPVQGPAPAHVPGFGEGPLPPSPNVNSVPDVNGDNTAADNAESQVEEIEIHTSENPAVNAKIMECREAFNRLGALFAEYGTTPTPKLKADGAKQKDALLKELTKLMKLSQASNDEAGMEEAADLRREVNKMIF